MTFQIRDSLIYRKQRRSIRSLPLDSYLTRGLAPCFQAPGSTCWRGYVGTWEFHNDELHLVHIHARVEDWKPIGLTDLFPGNRGSVEATWFSGQITPDDWVNPNDQATVEMHEMHKWPIQSLWFMHLVYKGKLVLEEVVDLKNCTVETRFTNHVSCLVSESEMPFLYAVRANLDDFATKLIYADWLEERGDTRSQVLRAEVEIQMKAGPRPRIYTGRSYRQDIPIGYVDPEDKLWYWRWLADVQECTAEDREFEEKWGRIGE